MAERGALEHRRHERQVAWWQAPLVQGVGFIVTTMALRRTGILDDRDATLLAAAAVTCAGMLSGSVTLFGDRFGDSVTHLGDGVTHLGDSVTHFGDRFGDSVTHLGDGVASIGASLDGVGAGVRAFGSRCASVDARACALLSSSAPCARSF